MPPGCLRGTPRSRLRLGLNEALEGALILPQKLLNLGLVGILGIERYEPVAGRKIFLPRKKIHLPDVLPPRPGHENLGFVDGIGVKVVIRVVTAENKMNSRNGPGELLLAVEIHMSDNYDNLAIFLLQFGDPFFCALGRVLETIFGLFPGRAAYRKPVGDEADQTDLNPPDILDEIGGEDRLRG